MGERVRIQVCDTCEWVGMCVSTSVRVGECECLTWEQCVHVHGGTAAPSVSVSSTGQRPVGSPRTQQNRWPAVSPLVCVWEWRLVLLLL